jgi:adenosylcobinamide-phosphate synthase
VLSTLGLGPAGAVLYRMAEFSSRYWDVKARRAGVVTNERLLVLSRRLFNLMDFIPARMTAFGFAIVGNFEEAVTCWRRDAGLWMHANEGIILAAAAGAVGVRLGGEAAPGASADRATDFDMAVAPELASASGSTTGALPQAGHLRSVVGLVWRSVVLWMLLLLALSLANLVG